MLPRSTVQAGKSKKCLSQQKNTMKKINKIRESKVIDKAHHATLEHDHI